MTTAARAPESETPMLDGQTETTPWAVALDRLEHPAPGQNHWLATVRPDGWPHLVPIIAFWIDGAFHFLAGEGTRKGRNLAADERCVIGTGNLTLPSLDLIVEGRARPVTEEATVRLLAEESVARAGRWRRAAATSTVRMARRQARRPTRSTGSSLRRCSASRGCSGCSRTTGTTSRRAGRSAAMPAESTRAAGKPRGCCPRGRRT
jgi:hypothetical protein